MAWYDWHVKMSQWHSVLCHVVTSRMTSPQIWNCCRQLCNDFVSGRPALKGQHWGDSSEGTERDDHPMVSPVMTLPSARCPPVPWQSVLSPVRSVPQCAARPAPSSVRIVVSVVRERASRELPGLNMADTRTANISKLVIKQAGRAKEKVTASVVMLEGGWVVRGDLSERPCDGRVHLYTAHMELAGLFWYLTINQPDGHTESSLSRSGQSGKHQISQQFTLSIIIPGWPLGLLNLVNSKHSGILPHFKPVPHSDANFGHRESHQVHLALLRATFGHSWLPSNWKC